MGTWGAQLPPLNFWADSVFSTKQFFKDAKVLGHCAGGQEVAGHVRGQAHLETGSRGTQLGGRGRIPDRVGALPAA